MDELTALAHRRTLQRRARSVLWLERLAGSGRPAAVYLLLAILVAFTGILGLLPDGLHLLVLLMAVGVLLHLLRQAWRKVAAPTPAQVARRIEEASGLKHQPLATLSDHPVTDAGNPYWPQHRQQALLALQSPLQAGHPRLSRRFRQTVVALTTCMLILSSLSHGQVWRNLAASLSPDVRIVGLNSSPAVQAWLEPPAHTGQPVQTLPVAGSITAPKGSILRLQAADSWLAPRLHTPGGSVRLSGQKLALPLQEDGTYRLRTGFATTAKWDVKVLPDQPPLVAMTGTPEADSTGALRIDYLASDDHSIASVWVVVERDGQQVRQKLVDMAQPVPEASGNGWLDMTAHPFAGQQVQLALQAIDATGQTGQSEPVTLTLPERTFIDPVARRLAGLRKDLLQRPESKQAVAMALDALHRQPDKLQDDLTVFLALRIATLRLQIPGEEIPPSVPPLLWKSALRLDGGGTGAADQRLRDAEAELRQKLQDPGTSAEELKQAFENLQNALIDYLQQLQASGLNIDQPPELANAQMQDMGDLLQQLQQMAAGGDRQSVLNALDQMRRTLDAVRQAQANPELVKAAMDALKELGDISRQQAELAEQLQQDKVSNAKAAGAQRKLAERLEKVAGELGKLGLPTPPQLGQAGEAMQRAAAGLGKGEREPGTQAAVEAADALSNAMQGMMQSLQQGQQGMFRLGLGGQGTMGTESIKVPDAARSRLQQILDDLRKRADDPDRPADEKDYLRRLLDVF